MRTPFDSRLDHDIDRSADNDEMLHVVTTNQTELPSCVDGRCLHHAEPLLPRPAEAGRVRLAEEGLERLDHKGHNGDDEEEGCDAKGKGVEIHVRCPLGNRA